MGEFRDFTEEQLKFTGLTLLQKYDAVLDVLFELSGKSPTFDDIDNHLILDKKKVHGGEIWDILNTMIGDGYVYNGLGSNQEQIFLLSFNGKYLKINGGLEKKLDREKKKEKLSRRQLKKSVEVSKWTKFNIGITVLVSFTTLSVLLFTCHRDTDRYNKESEQQSKDKLQQEQVHKTDSLRIERLYQLLSSLSDSSKVKVKIVK